MFFYYYLQLEVGDACFPHKWEPQQMLRMNYEEITQDFYNENGT